MLRLPVPLDRRALAVIGLLLGACLLYGSQAGPTALAACVLGSLIVFAVADRLSEPSDRRFVVLVSLGSFAVRAIVAAIANAILLGRNAYGAMFYDDGAYVALAAQMVSYWQGTATSFPRDPSVQNSFAAGVGALLWITDGNILVVRLSNALLMTLAGVLVYRTMTNLGLRGPRIGLVAALAFPSLSLWSILVLKDVYVVAWMMAAVWSVSEFVRSGRYAWFMATIAAMLVLDGVRRYIFLVLAIAWPIGVALASRGRRRLVAPSFALVAVVAILMSSRALDVYGDSFARLDYLRAAMAQGARTAFVEPLPAIPAEVGARYEVRVAGRGPEPGQSSRVVEVPVGSRIEVEESVGETAPSRPGIIKVRPGDVIVVVSAGTAGTAKSEANLPPSGTPTPIQLTPGARNVVASAEVTPPDNESGSVQRGLAESVAYLPFGLIFFIGAPFPWDARTVADVLAFPEMLAWYATLILSVFGAYRLVRRGAWGYAFGALAAGGIALVLSLAEGNAGTLLRHRAMAIIVLIPLAATAAADVPQRLRHLRDTRV